ncbi:hypothetical protein SEA_PUPPER_161 [Gordonia phage Pupper]|uniref:Uncharacterized protein n=1 Tax=Gordonia phage Pupper TaxID=2571249 RepID=A0A4Y6EKT3_9CAUD|nr:hypothetical protein KHQ83_gp116 [Gordonia phage Pupper]QDF18647.1 hypothetical protein SEA_PUPPER_161 [Gordonia phage Pupper]QDF18879.1 hypothetical protein SEA_SCENTAE_160 [Gordonia phage SCentae]
MSRSRNNDRGLSPDDLRRIRNMTGGTATDAEIERAVRDEIRSLPAVPASRCRICNDPNVLKTVNTGLAHGMQHGAVLKLLEAINAERPQRQKITHRAIVNHAREHFDLTNPALAAYRRILEKRYVENEDERVDASGSIVTAMGYLEIMAQKGFESLMNPETYINPEVGLSAILRLQKMSEAGSQERELAELRQKVSALGAAVRDIVPSEMWAEILAHMEAQAAGVGQQEQIDDAIDVDTEDEPYDPGIEHDPDDTLET